MDPEIDGGGPTELKPRTWWRPRNWKQFSLQPVPGAFRGLQGPFQRPKSSLLGQRPPTALPGPPQALFLELFACPLSEPCLGFQRQEQATIKIFR